MRQTGYFLFSASFVSALNIAVEPAALSAPTAGSRLSNPLLSVPASNATISVPISTTKNTSSASSDDITLPFGLPDCLAAYGKDLQEASCLDAWQSVPSDLRTRTYGRRSEGVFQAPLPQRYLSGKCFGLRARERTNRNLQLMAVAPLRLMAEKLAQRRLYSMPSSRVPHIYFWTIVCWIKVAPRAINLLVESSGV